MLVVYKKFTFLPFEAGDIKIETDKDKDRDREVAERERDRVCKISACLWLIRNSHSFPSKQEI